ncbi:MAG: carbamoyl-phosphate synthase (glutamine-hydrolyzing) small subunit [Planctomycetota bacterium]|nr:MAG: carbamoyl-phosphate synthase (glutamine-hydrolyzing) small subunit [Planctomycetota bacterium]
MADAAVSPPSHKAQPRHHEGRCAARLLLEDGTELRGRAFGATRSAAGEVVFATGMVGYPEAMTDPSFQGQILVCTYPLIGNYGVPAHAPGPDGLPPESFEAGRIHVSGLVVSTLSRGYSHWSAAGSLEAWMAEHGVVGIEGIDTRALTRRLRDRGTMPGKILVEADPGVRELDEAPFENVFQRNLVAEVSIEEPVLYGNARRRVILVDCGAKANIVRCLLRRGVSVLRVPWDHDFNREDADAILVSNGPGDPKQARATIRHLRTALEGDRPVFGICLGHQLLALAAGCETYKLPYGHRGQNQPCLEVGTRRCYITSQNHGYAVDGHRLPDGWEQWFINANDGTNEGLRHAWKPFRSVQFHPEAAPGPDDTAFLFDRFVESLR